MMFYGNVLLAWIGISSGNPSSVHTPLQSFQFFLELSGWKPEELQITVPSNNLNNPALLDACCPVNDLEAFSVHTIIAWTSSFWT